MEQKYTALLTQNSKIKKSKDKRTFNFGIPAYQSALGMKTCPNAGACAIGCYARQGAYTFGNVKPAFEARLQATMAPDFEARIQLELNVRRVERLRIHDSGDFYSEGYLTRWLRIIRANPHTEFYAYTKMISLFNKYKAAGLIPANFVVVYSYGGTEDKLINRDTDRHSLVFPTIRALNKAGYADARNNDKVALGPNPRIGLVYHGTKSIENTHWDRVKALKA